MTNHGDGNPIVDASVGSGKSVLVAAVCQRADAEYRGTRVVVVVPQKELLQQNADKLLKIWPNADLGLVSASVGRKVVGRQITYATIGSVWKIAHMLGRIDIMMVDEAHLISNKDEGMFRSFINDASKYNPHMRVIGWTGTPFRGNGVWLTDGEAPLFNAIASSVKMTRLLEEGYLCPLVPAETSAKIRTEGVSVAGGDYVLKDLAAASDKEELIAAACDEGIELAKDRKRWIVFGVTVDHATHIRDYMRSRGITAEVLHGALGKKERDKIVQRYRAGDFRCLVNVAVATTGFDVPEIDCIMLMRATQSQVLYCLDSATEILTSRGWMAMGDINVGDRALALNEATGRGVWSPVTGVVQRPMDSGEEWVEYDAPRANFRVTSGHRMIFKTSVFGGGWSGWRTSDARTMAGFKNGVLMPTAVSIDQPGVPLTDDELYIIGMLMTDGWWSTNQAVISQSERHPEILERIESALCGAGIAYVKSEDLSKSQFKRNYRAWRYSISMGDPRCGRPGKGLRYLLPFLDKELSPALMSVSRDQFITLIKSMWDGDGIKTHKSAHCNWTPRGWSICSARKATVDRLQALAVMHGCTANVRCEHGPSRRNPIWHISVNDQDWRSVGGCGPRPQMVVKPATDELVWCVETGAGTIVTRRNGKVTVMGNCQIAGRGMRLVGQHISESIANGKADCLWLDFTDTTMNMGPVDKLVGRAMTRGAKADAPFKICPQCGSQNATARLKCSSCGFDFPPPERINHDAKASKAAVLSMQQAQYARHDITGCEYFRHSKAGAPDSMRVHYKSGLQIVATEYIHFDRRGPLRFQAEGWWTRRALYDGIPGTTSDAVVLAQQGVLRVPKAITMTKSKYPEIVDQEF